MARNYPANTQIQKFIEEAINKETQARIAFSNREKAPAAGRSRQHEVFRAQWEKRNANADSLKKLPEGYKPPTYNKCKPRYDHLANINARITKDKVLITAEMRPVTPKIRGNLYDGFTKEGKGRYMYLNERSGKKPEDKYSFPVCSSWEYGWRLGEVIPKEDIKKPQFGRTRIVADTFYTRTGILAVQPY